VSGRDRLRSVARRLQLLALMSVSPDAPRLPSPTVQLFSLALGLAVRLLRSGSSRSVDRI
jgi:hypothetical protein